MGDKTKIEYLDATWSPIKGCALWTSWHQSPGCKNCWARRQAARFSKPGEIFEGLTIEGKWTGLTKLYPHELTKPIRWKRPRRIGVSFMGDMFNAGTDWRDQAAVFGAILMSPQHQFLLLTKRPAGIMHFVDCLNHSSIKKWLDEQLIDTELLPAQLCVEIARRKTAEPCFDYRKLEDTTFPPKNVWAGTSVENQGMANKRIPLLRCVQAHHRWLSIEPIIHRVSIEEAVGDVAWSFLDFVVVGGESGPGYRPMDLGWARDIRDECNYYGVPFFFKQTAGKGLIPEDLQIRELPDGLNITTPKSKEQNNGEHQESGRT